MTHGPEYKTNGKRPVWLNDGDEISVVWRDGVTDNRTARHITLCGWPSISAIRLPSGHWANAAIESGFEPWSGGDVAPDDWDGSWVLLRNGTEWSGLGFSWKRIPIYDGSDIIGYKKKDSVVSELPKDVTALVIAARRVWEGLDFSTIASTEGHELDKALEAFSSRVPYEDEPHESVVSEGVAHWARDVACEYDEAEVYHELARMIQAYEPHRKPKDRDEEIADKWVEKFFHSEIGVKQTILSAIKEAKA